MLQFVLNLRESIKENNIHFQLSKANVRKRLWITGVSWDFDETVLKTHHMSRSIWFEGLGLVVSQLGLPTLDIA